MMRTIRIKRAKKMIKINKKDNDNDPKSEATHTHTLRNSVGRTTG